MTKQQNAISWRSALLAGIAAAFATGAAMPAMAADNAKVITSSSEKVKVRITGQINRAVLYYDDDFNNGIKHVDNDLSSTRFRWHADAKVNSDIKIGAIMEIAAKNNSNATSDQDTNGGGDSNTSVQDRRLEFWVDHNKLGRIYIGKGSTASDNSSHQTAHAGGVANATVLGFAVAGGLNFKNNGNPCTAGNNTCVQLGGAAGAMTVMDGLGRANRIRYDTPVFAGFQARAGHVDGGRTDAALFYNGKMFDTRIRAAAAYAWGNNGATRDQVNGSVSVQHSSGIGATFAGGYRNEDGRDNDGSFTHDPVMLAFGLNFDRKYSEMGVTSLSGQYHRVDSLAASGDIADVISISVVQHIDAAAFEAYATYMHGELETRDNGTTFGDLDAVLIGGRIKF